MELLHNVSLSDGEDDNIAHLNSDIEDDVQVPVQVDLKEIPKEERKTTKYMTKYEMARIIGIRALQISQCAPVMVELENETDPMAIARKELYQGVIPMKICRYLPNGFYEIWDVSELICNH